MIDKTKDTEIHKLGCICMKNWATSLEFYFFPLMFYGFFPPLSNEFFCNIKTIRKDIKLCDLMQSSLRTIHLP